MPELPTSQTRLMPRRQVGVVAAVTSALLASTLCVGTSPAVAAANPCWEGVSTDLDGGGPDVVVGLPSYDLPDMPDAGALVVYSNVAEPNSTQPRPPSARTLLTADDFVGMTAQAGARFGAAVVAGRASNATADDCADLWVGAPGHRVGGLNGAGRVYLLHGSDTGLKLNYEIDMAGIAEGDGPQAGAGFGSALAVESLTTLAIGEPGRDIGSAVDAGRVIRLDDLDSPDEPNYAVVQQGGNGAGSPESGDRFGEVLKLAPTGAGTILFIGVPREDVGNLVDAGAVAMDPRVGELSMVTQNSPGAAGRAESRDRYGASIDVYSSFAVDHPIEMALIGVPGEDVGGVVDAGMLSFASVDLFVTSPSSVSAIKGRSLTQTQDTRGVPGSVESGDGYGSAVVTGEFGILGGRQRVVATAPGEDLGSAANAGLLTMTTVNEEDATPAAGEQPGAWTQNSAGVSGVAETGDRFGSALSAVLLTQHVIDGDENEPGWPVIMVTVPNEDVGTVADVGMAYLGVAPGLGSVELVPPVLQRGAGIGMVPMQIARAEL
jgi:hypothetical protein